MAQYGQSPTPGQEGALCSRYVADTCVSVPNVLTDTLPLGESATRDAQVLDASPI